MPCRLQSVLLVATIVVMANAMMDLFVPRFSMAQDLEEALLDQQANQLYQQGQYADAEPLVKRALAIREKTLGPEHRDVGVLLYNLAVLYDIQGRYADAEPLYKRALAIREKT